MQRNFYQADSRKIYHVECTYSSIFIIARVYIDIPASRGISVGFSPYEHLQVGHHTENKQFNYSLPLCTILLSSRVNNIKIDFRCIPPSISLHSFIYFAILVSFQNHKPIKLRRRSSRHTPNPYFQIL